MAFCPACKYEYVAGIETCPDCGEKLVETLPEHVPERIEDVHTVTVGMYPNEIELDMAKLKLDMVDIESTAIMGSIAWRTPGVFVSPVSPGFRLQVREADAARAARVLSETDDQDSLGEQ